MSEEAVDGTAEEVEPQETIEAAAARAAETGMFAGDVHDADDYKPGGRELVVTPDRDVYEVMSRADEVQILDELQGRALDVMVYSFKPSGGGKAVTDLSYAGVREVVRTLNRGHYTAIKISGARPPLVDEITEDGKDYVRVMVYAEDESTGAGQWGVATEPKYMELKNGKTKWDKFALTKALNKAQRNAMKALLPLEFTETIVAQFLGDASRVKQIAAGPGAEKVAELPPPLDTPEMKALQEQIRERYRVLQGLNRLALLPARFNELFTRVAHDLERTKDFLGHVENLIEQAELERDRLAAQKGGGE